jgi:radical SAM protein with 4Fe4S-binding SPASM domain
MFESVKKGFRTIGRELKVSVQRELNFYQMKPIVGTLILTYHCTSRCKTCTIWQRSSAGPKELGLEEWKGIVTQLSNNNIKVVEIFGGDVFLRKDLLMPLIRFMKEKGLTIHLPTNGNLLTQDIARGLVDNGVDVIYLSIDGVGPVQDKIRGVMGTYDRVTRAFNFLDQARNGKGKPRLICNTTVSNLNIGSLEDIADAALKMGFDENHFEYVGEFGSNHIERSIVNGIKPVPYYLKQDDSVLLNKHEAIKLRHILWSIRKKYAKTSLDIRTVNIDTLSLKNLYNGTIDNKKGYVLRTEVTVDPYGNVVPCMHFNNYFFGNLLKSDLSDIWNCAKHRDFINQQKHGKFEICNHCILGAQRNHSFYMSLKRIYYIHILNWYLTHYKK